MLDDLLNQALMQLEQTLTKKLAFVSSQVELRQDGKTYLKIDVIFDDLEIDLDNMAFLAEYYEDEE